MNYLIFLFIAATTLVLLSGLIFMAIGGKINRKMGNKLMTFRVVFQALAIMLIIFLYKQQS